MKDDNIFNIWKNHYIFTSYLPKIENIENVNFKAKMSKGYRKFR